MLLHMAPSPVTRLHRAIALRYVTGPAAALRDNGRTADAARADQALGTMLNAESERLTAQDAIVARNAAIRAATRAAEAPAERAADAMGETPEAKR